MSNNNLEQLEKLHELHEKKVISSEEYQSKKQQIMSQVGLETIKTKQTQKSFIFSVISVVLGCLIMLMLLGTNLWSLDAVIGGLVFSVGGIVFGLLSFKGQEEKSKIGIVGVILSVLATLLLFCVDYYSF